MAEEIKEIKDKKKLFTKENLVKAGICVGGFICGCVAFNMYDKVKLDKMVKEMAKGFGYIPGFIPEISEAMGKSKSQFVFVSDDDCHKAIADLGNMGENLLNAYESSGKIKSTDEISALVVLTKK